MTMRKYSLLGISLILLAYILKWGILLFLILSLVVIGMDKCGEKKKMLVAIGICFHIAGFFIAKIQAITGVLLWGYSVFAFSGIAFMVDQYRYKRVYAVTDILLYLFFFPKIFAGPIVRPHLFISQLSEKIKYDGSHFYKAFKITVYALFLKFFIADNLIVNENFTGINLLMSSLVWGIRFYFDFYAYSLLAVGIAMFCGINLPYNFNNPYFSNTFHEFWKRWNITLSAWLRDYIYIPLGGNRKGRSMTYANILVVFVISGLWHGLTLPFVIWGLLNGMLVCIEKTIVMSSSKIIHCIYGVFVTTVIMLLWQLFKLNDLQAITSYFHRLYTATDTDTSVTVLLIVSLVLLLIVESKIIKILVFGTSKNYIGVFGEVVFFTLILAAFALIPNHYSFNFFYLNF